MSLYFWHFGCHAQFVRFVRGKIGGVRSMFSCLFLCCSGIGVKQKKSSFGSTPPKNDHRLDRVYKTSPKNPIQIACSHFPQLVGLCQWWNFWKGKNSVFLDNLIWVVVSNIFYFHPYLGKIPILTNIFQRGWNHQLVIVVFFFCM